MTTSRGFLAVFVLLSVIRPPEVVAQITVTYADALAQLTTSGFTTSSEVQDPSAFSFLQTLADRSGDGQTWDLSALPWTNPITVISSPVAEPVPGSGIITGATHILQVTDGNPPTYVFSRLSATSVEALGSASNVDDGTGTPTIGGVQFTPFNPVYPLPLTATSAWSGTYGFRAFPETEGFTVANAQTAAVEGWGTLVTQTWSAQVLKVRRSTVSTTTIVVPGLPPFVVTSAYKVIEFISTTGVGATIDLDGDGNATGASLSSPFGGVPTSNEGPSRIGPSLTLEGENPIRRGGIVALHLDGPEGMELRVDVFDAIGRRVTTLADGSSGAGPQRLELSTDALAPGVYIIRASAGALMTSKRLVVLR